MESTVDCYVLLKNKSILKICEIFNNSHVLGNVSTVLRDFYIDPCLSKNIGIFKFRNFSSQLERIPLDEILSKVFVMNCDNYFVACELMHLNI